MRDPFRIETLKRRKDFLRLNEDSCKFATPFFLIIRKPNDVAPMLVRVGYTVTKKVGNAVVRNRIKRRLKAAVKDTFASHAAPGHDYIFIARIKTLEASYSQLTESLRFALSHLHKARSNTDERKTS